MRRDDETFLSELELWPLIKIQRAAQGLVAPSESAPPARETNVKRSAMPPSAASAASAKRLSGTSPVAQDYARRQVAEPPPPRPPITMKTVEAVEAVEAIMLDPARANKIAALDWLGIQNTVSACADCGLCKQRKQAVFGNSLKDAAANAANTATWMFVGAAPELEDDAQGEPFLGDAGQLVDAMLRAAGLRRGEGVFLTNALKCRPPGNRTPTTTEIATCLPYLQRQIALVQPKIIIAFGKIAAQALTGLDAPITELRGKVHQVDGVAVIATLSPAFLLRNMPEKAKVWEDILLAKQTLNSLS